MYLKSRMLNRQVINQVNNNRNPRKVTFFKAKKTKGNFNRMTKGCIQNFMGVIFERLWKRNNTLELCSDYRVVVALPRQRQVVINLRHSYLKELRKKHNHHNLIIKVPFTEVSDILFYTFLKLIKWLICFGAAVRWW